MRGLCDAIYLEAAYQWYLEMSRLDGSSLPWSRLEFFLLLRPFAALLAELDR